MDGIVVLPNTVQGASRGALAAKSAGIPVVNLLWSHPTPGDAAYVARVRVDDVLGGQLVGEWITKNTKPGGILLVTGVPGQGFSEDLTKGIEQALQNHGNGKWFIAASQPGLFVRTTAINVAQNMLTAHPEAKIIYSMAAEMGNGVASLLKKTGRKDVVNISDDGNAEMVRWMKSGWIQAARYYSGAQEALLGVQALRAYLEHGKKFAEPIDVVQGMAVPRDIDHWVAKQPLSYPQYKRQVQSIG